MSSIKNVVRKVSLIQIVYHKKLVGKFPGYGVGFKVSKKDWDIDHYYIIKRSYFRTFRQGQIYGHLYQNGRLKSQYLTQIQGYQRGVWNFDVNGASAQIDGLIYESWQLQKLAQKMKKKD